MIELRDDFGESAHAHVEAEGAAFDGDFCETFVIGLCLVFFGVFVSGDECDGGCDITVGDGDAGVCCSGHGSGDAGDDFNMDIVLVEDDGFFRASAEDIGVSAFEPDDDMAFSGLVDEELVGLILGKFVFFCSFSGVDEFGVWGDVIEEERVGECVENDASGGF